MPKIGALIMEKHEACTATEFCVARMLSTIVFSIKKGRRAASKAESDKPLS